MIVQVEPTVDIKMHTELSEAICYGETLDLVDLIVYQCATPVQVEQAYRIYQICQDFDLVPSKELSEAYLYGTGVEELVDIVQQFNQSENE